MKHDFMPDPDHKSNYLSWSTVATIRLVRNTDCFSKVASN